MPDRDLQTLLAERMRDVLEMSFFTNILQETVPQPLITSLPSMAATVEFSGAASGSFLLVATPLAVRTLALEFMGDSAEDRDAEAACANPEKMQPAVPDEEVFKELTNILCGSVLSRFETDRCCNLSRPVMCSGKMIEDWIASGTSIRAGVLLEEGLVASYWKLDGPR
jgi:Chemotaxis phosphatase CheX